MRSDSEEIVESKAARVNIVSDNTARMAKIGVALVSLLESMGKAAGDGECVVYGNELQIPEFRLKDTRFGTEIDMEGIFLLIFMGFVVIGIFAAGCCAGWCFGYLTRPSVTSTIEKKKEGKGKSEDVKQATRPMKCRKVEGTSVMTQSQTTYAWHRESPRFIPLAERAHGAWRE